MNETLSAVFLCNGASPPTRAKRYRQAATLEYRDGTTIARNVEICLPRFIAQVAHLDDRLLDLLEIAGYVFAGDRLTTRGRTDSLEYHSWSRTIEYVIRVRDISFWSRSEIGTALSAALHFMTGDHEHRFSFVAGQHTEPSHLFDQAGVTLPAPQDPRVMLFSGGLDSLAGSLELVAQPTATACLVSHESQHGTIRTQRSLAQALQERFPGRVRPFSFRCRLTDKRAPEETQRTRSFLYLATAFGVATALSLTECSVYENGFTAFAFPERQDLLNSRASRTTHPKTLALMERFLSLVAQTDFHIRSPFRWLTKADVLQVIRKHNADDLLTSSISCSATFQKAELGRQCGRCSQCVERRLAAFAVGLDDIDSSGSYAFDFIKDEATEPGTKTLLIDYLRLARDFVIQHEDWFAVEKINELADLVEHVDGVDEFERVAKIWDLCQRHGKGVFAAMSSIRSRFCDLARPRPKGILLDIISDQDYLKDPVERLIERLRERFKSAVPIAFATSAPKHENQLNDQIDAILRAESLEFEREFPVVRFGTAKTVPDHSNKELDLFIEAKLLRESTSASKITDQLAADTFKYGAHRRIFFVLYDPDRAIKDDVKFAEQFQTDGRFAICIVR